MLLDGIKMNLYAGLVHFENWNWVLEDFIFERYSMVEGAPDCYWMVLK